MFPGEALNAWGIPALAAGAGLCAGGWAMLRRARGRVAVSAGQARAATEELQAYVDLLPIGLRTIDAKGALVLCNRKAPDMLGLTPDQLQAVDWAGPVLSIIDADGDGLEAEPSA